MRRAVEQAIRAGMVSILAVAVLCGCGGAPRVAGTAASSTDASNNTDNSQTDDPVNDNVVDDEAFTFAEDVDPLVAALPFEEDKLLIRTLPGAEADDLQTAYEQAGVAVAKELAEIQTTVLRVEPARQVDVAATLSANPLVEAVQKSYLYESDRTPNDPKFSSQDYLETIGLPEAWEITTGSEEIIIAILDSGVAADHLDLADKLVDGWNTYNDNNRTADVRGHGTSVAGVAAATANNRRGIAGVSWKSPIMPLRVTNSQGSASTQAIAAGLVWAVDHGARVMNISFAPLASDRTVARAARYVRNSGGLVFISAGNDGKASRAKGTVNALFVGAVDNSYNRAPFSTTGPFVDLAAPGIGIQTAQRDGGYGRVAGTSFASPIAGGVAALIWSVRPELRPVTVEDILAETAIDLGDSGCDDEFGAGLLDAASAVEMALDIAEHIGDYPPSVRITTPRDRQSVSGVIRVKANAFNAGDLENATRYVVDVVLSVDGGPFATDTASPFQFALNTAKLAPGIHTLTCVAHDTAGNESYPKSVRITVGQGASSGGGGGTSGPDTIDPLVVINYPVSGTRVTSKVGIGATLSDNDGLKRVEWRVDGVSRKSVSVDGTRAEVNWVWDTQNASRGAHTITVRVTDTTGNYGSASISLIKE